MDTLTDWGGDRSQRSDVGAVEEHIMGDGVAKSR